MTKLASERPFSRLAAFGLHRTFEPIGGRAAFLLQRMRRFIQGTVLDVGAGSNALPFRAEFGPAYRALDISDSYKVADLDKDDLFEYVSNIDNVPLPFEDRSFDTVLCMDVLEHIDNTHLLRDELFRISRGRVLISLPNNWSRFYWSFLAGHNVTHTQGYGLGASPKPPGMRHKHFFNMEEAFEYLSAALPDDFEIEHVELVFEHGTDGVLASAPLLRNAFRLGGKLTMNEARHRFGSAAHVAFALTKIGFVALRALDLAVTIPVYAWGDPVRFYNLFCRQLWVVFRRKSWQPAQ